MARSAKWCAVCRSGYRSWGEHASTDKHRRNVYRRNNPTGRTRSLKREVRRAGNRAARRSQERYLDATLLRVRSYRRSRPNDGKAKVVKVRGHRRADSGVFYTRQQGYTIMHNRAGDGVMLWRAGDRPLDPRRSVT